VPISFEVDRERRRVRTVADGVVAVSDVAAHLEDLVARGLESYAELVDARHASRPGWYSADVRKAADLVHTVGGGSQLGPRAVVVSRTAAFGMVRMLSALLGARLRLEVFRDLPSAERWLDGAGPAGGTTA